jgi:transposase-like protein
MAMRLEDSAYLALGRQIEIGQHACPDCGRRLTRWGGYWRWFRGSATQRLWIRRGRCSSCRRSHALLPDFLLKQRLDHVEVIGHALVLGVMIGSGMRTVAEQLGVPMTTVRDWQRRFRVRAPALTAAIVALAVHLDPAGVLLEGGPETAAMQALGAAWYRARRRFAHRIPRLWQFWGLISRGQALGTNRSPPATRRLGAGWMAPSL